MYFARYTINDPLRAGFEPTGGDSIGFFKCKALTTRPSQLVIGKTARETIISHTFFMRTACESLKGVEDSNKTLGLRIYQRWTPVPSGKLRRCI